MGADVPELTASATDWIGPWLDWLDAALHREVLRLRTRYRLCEDELHGLYVSDKHVDALLTGRLPPMDAVPRPRVSCTLAAVAAEFGLDDKQTTALAIALAPEIDVRYRSVFGYLNDDVGRPLPSVELCARLAGAGASLSTTAPLFADGLVEVVRTPAAPHWGAAGLLPTDAAREFLLGVSSMPVPPADQAFEPAEHGEVLRAARDDRVRLVVVEAAVQADAMAATRGLAAALGRPLVELDAPDGGQLRAAVVRARLHHAAVLLTGTDHAALRVLSREPVLTVVAVESGAPWRSRVEGLDHAVLTVATPAPARRAQLWRAHLRENRTDIDIREVAAVSELFALGPTQIAYAAAAAGRDGVRPLAAHARDQSRARLPEFAQLLDPGYRWGDLVLPEPTLRRLRELASAIRHRSEVFDTWGFRRRAGGVASIRALFSGVSGTGKTMSAAVLAADLGLPLWRVDLSAVVSKYIGETEKNLEEVFRAVEASSALLMFDEAEALFGKRSEVSDARDRYANIEVAYLLQRIETFDGALILATNLPTNLDEAFSRRLQVAIDFPLPDVPDRERLWRRAVPAAAPVGGHIDVQRLARAFPLSGGEIANIALAAALLAAHEDNAIDMDHLIRSIARHRLRQGKLPSAGEFGDLLHLARAEGG